MACGKRVGWTLGSWMEAGLGWGGERESERERRTERRDMRGERSEKKIEKRGLSNLKGYYGYFIISKHSFLELNP